MYGMNEPMYIYLLSKFQLGIDSYLDTLIKFNEWVKRTMILLTTYNVHFLLFGTNKS